MITRDELIQYVESRKLIWWDNLEKNNNDIYTYLITFGKGRTLKESYFMIRENLMEIPKCEICGKNKVFYGAKNKPWASTCGNKTCINEIRSIHIKNFNLKHFGVEYTFQREDCKQNIGKTKLEKYGDYYWANPEKTKETMNKKSAEEKQDRLNKIKDTCNQRYGVDNVWQSDEVKNKIKQTWIKKYGVDHPAKTDEFQKKIIKTCLSRYGVERYQSTDEFRELVSNKMSSEETLYKRKCTCKSRYGVDNVMQVPEIKEKMFNTCKLNGSFGPHSKLEDKVFEKLIKKFYTVERQYKDKERYPFACDFYIPDIDLFIECQFHPSHGKHPFNNLNKEDKILSERLKNSEPIIGQPRYDVWIIRDVKKRETAKQNNLNYLEFFNLKEFNEWYEKI